MSESSTPQKQAQDPEQKKIYNLYAVFGISIVLSVIPNGTAAGLSIIFLTWALIAGYITRRKAEEHSLSENHAVFVIRTLWIAAGISILTTIISSFYMLERIDYTPFQGCAETIASQGIAALEQMSTMQLYAMVQPCLDSFLGLNIETIKVAMVIAGGPPIVYMGYRFFKGISRAIKGYRLADPKAWF